jgi:hypothetical protein
MTEAGAIAGRIPLTKSLIDELTVLAMYAWFGAILATTAYAAIQPGFTALPTEVRRIPVENALTVITPIERHCIVATAIAESTPMAKVETIEIMRNILRRREMGTWGATACAVVTAPRQYSAWNDRMLPGVPAKPGAQYRLYSEWLDEALEAGPSVWSHYIHPKTMVLLYGYRYPKWWAKCVETKMIQDAEFCRMAL